MGLLLSSIVFAISIIVCRCLLYVSVCGLDALINFLTDLIPTAEGGFLYGLQIFCQVWFALIYAVLFIILAVVSAGISYLLAFSIAGSCYQRLKDLYGKKFFFPTSGRKENQLSEINDNNYIDKQN